MSKIQHKHVSGHVQIPECRHFFIMSSEAIPMERSLGHLKQGKLNRWTVHALVGWAKESLHQRSLYAFICRIVLCLPRSIPALKHRLARLGCKAGIYGRHLEKAAGVALIDMELCLVRLRASADADVSARGPAYLWWSVAWPCAPTESQHRCMPGILPRMSIDVRHRTLLAAHLHDAVIEVATMRSLVSLRSVYSSCRNPS